MGASSSSSEQQQRPHSAGTSVNRRANSLRRAEEMAQLEKERMAERRAQLIMERRAEEMAQRDKERRAEEMAQRERERMAEEIAQLRMKRGPLFFPRPHLRMVKRSLILEYPPHLIMDTGSLESIDSGVSLKSDQSKDEPIDFKDRVSPRWVDSFLSEKKHNVTYVEDWIKSSDDLMTERNRLSIESFDSGVSFKSDWSKDVLIDVKYRVSPSRLDLSSFEKKRDVADDEGLVESPDDLMTERNRLSIESFDSGVSFKSDWSKDVLIDVKYRVSPSRLDLSSFEKKRDVADDEGLVESPDDLEDTRQAVLKVKIYAMLDHVFPTSTDYMRTSATSTDSGVSISSVDRIINFSHRPDNSSSKEEHIVADDDDLIQCSDDLVLPKCTASTESGSVYIQSDGSQGCTEHFEDTPSPSTKRKNSLKNVFKNLFKINPSREDKWQI